MSPIGIIHSCFKEKFGIPRQPGLVPEARAQLELISPYDRDEALRELQGFSHIWLLFLFHATARSEWKATVRPPRLGGNQRIGVFASRSTFRPNPVGLSVVRLEAIYRKEGKLMLELSGIDLMDATPVIDIKPYLPYVDAIPDAVGGYAREVPEGDRLVQFSPLAEQICMEKEADGLVNLRQMIVSLLQLDPRPAYNASKNKPEVDREYGMRLYDFDLKWTVNNDIIQVIALESV
ncbi:MAG: tRNA (N6-threonylcarbamoyladenosine(37)-N6)-methyltransferase TrmO [Gammaproteobacteria bacterium]|nr:tRNA (N6-threonylcarbamoyladenosine(37)-N6)-methyltransferase TrmO [Gammaproteobacteria bacterium]